MKVRNVYYGNHFEEMFLALPKAIQKKADKALALVQKNAFYPSLRLHKLSGKMNGYWSISIDRRYRIVFLPLKDGDVQFMSIGTHAIYDD